MTLVVDASVALKWVLQEDGSDVAESLLYGAASEALIAPTLLYFECANTLWSKVRRGLIPQSQATAGLAKILDAPIDILFSDETVRSALAIAVQIDRSAYDSLYLALAITEGAKLVTADLRFAAAAEAHPVYGAHIRRLSA